MECEGASAIELIDALYKQERHPDLELVQALLGRGDEVVPDLIEVVENNADWPQIHAALLLCELQAEAALPALRRAMSAPKRHGMADWLTDDALEKFGPVALDMLEAIASDKAVEWHPRAMACRVMMTIVLCHPETYDRVTAFLRSLLPAPDLDWQSYEGYEAIKEAVDDPQIWTTAVARLCNLRDPKAYDLIGQLFQAGLIDEMAVDQGTYQKMYQSDPPASYRKEPISLVEQYERNQPKKTPKITKSAHVALQREKRKKWRKRKRRK
ncbi:MAG: hypothetical protein GY832_42800 [Chloroflexi bacterium]|nr:hypothetical protein [Chloroflexota bacterium]